MDRAHILVVDRDPIFLSLMAELLQEEGFHASTWEDGASAHRAIVVRRPSLVILDIHLDQPGLGVRLLQSLTQDPRTQAIPVIICSADGALLARHAECFPTEGYPIITKPFDLDELISLARLQLQPMQPMQPMPGDVLQARTA